MRRARIKYKHKIQQIKANRRHLQRQARQQIRKGNLDAAKKCGDYALEALRGMHTMYRQFRSQYGPPTSDA